MCAECLFRMLSHYIDVHFCKMIIAFEWFGWFRNAGNPTQVAIMMKSDARADVLAENARLADDFIKTLFAIVYEVYGSSVHLCHSSICSPFALFKH